jgi:hypothetical protein
MTPGGQPSNKACQFCDVRVGAEDTRCAACGAALQSADAPLPPDLAAETPPPGPASRVADVWTFLTLALASPIVLSFAFGFIVHFPNVPPRARMHTLGLVYTGLSMAGGGLLGALGARRRWCARTQAMGIMLLSTVSAYCNWSIISLLGRRL